MRHNDSLVCELCTSNLILEDLHIDFLLDVCICHKCGDIVYIKDCDVIYYDILRFLELKGYLVSTDIEDSLLRVKLNCNRMIMKNGKFCWCN